MKQRFQTLVPEVIHSEFGNKHRSPSKNPSPMSFHFSFFIFFPLILRKRVNSKACVPRKSRCICLYFEYFFKILVVDLRLKVENVVLLEDGRALEQQLQALQHQLHTLHQHRSKEARTAERQRQSLTTQKRKCQKSDRFIDKVVKNIHVDQRYLQYHRQIPNYIFRV